MTKEEMEVTLEGAVDRAVDKAIKQTSDFYVEKERHYNEHNFIKDLMDWMDRTKGVIWKSIVSAIVLAVLGVFVLGFVVWLTMFKGH